VAPLRASSTKTRPGSVTKARPVASSTATAWAPRPTATVRMTLPVVASSVVTLPAAPRTKTRPVRASTANATGSRPTPTVRNTGAERGGRRSGPR